MKITAIASAILLLATGILAAEPTQPTQPAKAALPRLVELGSTSCIPCKRMKPIIDELTKEQAGVIDVEFIDVNKDREKAVPYKVRIIPCQVFIDASGKERFRHEGFWSKKDITAKWTELGVKLKDASAKDTPATPSKDAEPAAGACCPPAAPSKDAEPAKAKTSATGKAA